jgi:hypothetical protein
MATCPSCGTSSRVEPGALVVDEVLVLQQRGTWSLAGVGEKFPATRRHRLACRCGWSILGRVEGGSFLGDPATSTGVDGPGVRS